MLKCSYAWCPAVSGGRPTCHDLSQQLQVASWLLQVGLADLVCLMQVGMCTSLSLCLQVTQHAKSLHMRLAQEAAYLMEECKHLRVVQGIVIY